MANPFTDFVLATKPKRLPDAPAIVRNATAPRTLLVAEMFASNPARQMLQSGEHIFDLIRLDKFSGAESYLPYDDVNSEEPEVLSKIKTYWRLHRSSFNYSEEQLKLNSSEEAWIRLLENWRQAAEQGLYESLQSYLVADPDPLAESQETFEGKIWNSIFSFITTNGAVPSEYTTAGVTTVMGVNPATKTDWKNQYNTYTAADFDGTIFNAMQEMKDNLAWEVPNPKAWVENSVFRAMHIRTSSAGRRAYINWIAEKGNRFFSKSDIYNEIGDPTFFNLPIKRDVHFDAKGWTSPRFYWLDWNYLNISLHTEMFLKEQDPVKLPNKTNVHRVDTLTWGNLFCGMRNRLGVTYGA